MNQNDDRQALERSRPFGVAEELVGAPVDRDVVLAKTVILSAGAGVMSSVQAQWCFLDSMRLLSRVVGRLEVVPPEDAPQEFAAAVRALVGAVWSQGSVEVMAAGDASWTEATATLCIHEPHARGVAPVVVGSVGWIAHVGASPVAARAAPNPMAALMAASVGVTEVFKLVYGVSAEVAPRLEREYFNLFSLTNDDPAVGPDLPSHPSLPDTLLLGGGAIGNAIAHLLERVRPTGRLIIIDKDAFAPENRGTCMLLDDRDWLKRSKAEALAEYLTPGYGGSVAGWRGRIEDAIGGDVLQGYDVDLVLGGLDDIGARREVQRLWPALLVDGAINSRGATSIARRFSDQSLGCLRCAFDEPPRSLSSYSDAERELYAKRGAICAHLDGESSREALGVELEEGFRPSVPFVASASAALVVAQALKAMVWPEERLSYQLQLESLFLGFTTAQRLRRAPKAGCECTKLRDVIAKLVAGRAERRKTSEPRRASSR